MRLALATLARTGFVAAGSPILNWGVAAFPTRADVGRALVFVRTVHVLATRDDRLANAALARALTIVTGSPIDDR